MNNEIGSAGIYTSIFSWLFKKTNFVQKNEFLKSSGEGKMPLGMGILFSSVIAYSALFSYFDGTFGVHKSFLFADHLISGFLLILGARISGGCASNQGIAALSSLSVRSSIVVPFMFIGGFIGGYIRSMIY